MAHYLLQWFSFPETPELQPAIERECGILARFMDETLWEGTEKTTGLRKLLEAKDCFLRAVKEQQRKATLWQPDQ
jgi:hypothetical protein